MAGVIFGVFCCVSVICAVLTGRLENLSSSLFSGTEDAVRLMLSLGGAMCLWGGMLEVLREMGALAVLGRLLSPLLRLLFPELCTAFPASAKSAGAKKAGAEKVDDGGDAAMEDITASLAANLLGIGNAATPIGLRAMKRLRMLRTGDGRMSDAEILFTTLNTAPPTLLPTTLLAMRHAAGSPCPTAVLPAVWAVSLLGFLFAAALTRMLAHHGRGARL